MKSFIKRLSMVAMILGIGLVMAPNSQPTPLPQGDRDTNKNAGVVEDATKARVQESYGKLPLYFIQNDGQVDKKVKFYEKGSNHATFFTKEGVYLSLVGSRSEKLSTSEDGLKTKSGLLNSKLGTPKSKPETLHSTLIMLSALDANKNPKIIAEGLQEGRVNYFIGNDPKKWRTDIPTYQVAVYQDMYPGIDMKFYGNNRQLEYDIVVKPGADPSKVRLAYEGIEGLRVTSEGDLEIDLKDGKVIQRKPYVYQEIDGKHVAVEGGFKLLDPKSASRKPQFAFAFEVASYDRSHPLMIDPALVYSTYLGGSGYDAAFGGIAVDGSGNAYVMGSTQSTDFPTASPLQAVYGGGSFDVFVAKLNAAGSALLYSTYLGGSVDDEGHGIAVDGSGNAYVTGITASSNFPTASPLQAANGGGSFDAFVAKLNAAGSALVYSTYLGGNNEDGTWGIAVDGSGNAYVSGWTYSTNFPTASPLQSSCSSCPTFDDAFVAKLNAAGSALVYSTYLGGSGGDGGTSIAVDGSGNAYVTGFTASTNFPTASPLQAANGGGYDAFVAKLNAAGSALLYSTYLGGYANEEGYGIAVDGSGNAYVTGWTASTDFPTVNALQPINAGGSCPFGFECGDAFVAKLNPTGSALIYSTYLGGSGNEVGYRIAVDGSGNVYATGSTASSNFPTASPLQAANGGGFDAFVAEFNAAGSALVYSTYLGGGSDDEGRGIAVDGSGNAYVTGLTASTNFPTANALQPAFAGGTYDVFVAKISAPGPSITFLSPLSGSSGTSVSISGTGFGATQGTSTVTFNGVVATVTFWSATLITASVPCSATTGPVVVTVNSIPSNGVTFTVIPRINSISPTSGITGTTVTISGCGFASPSVTFNGMAATVSSSTATQITTTVPADATTGPVVVTVGGNPSNGVTFTVIPNITSVSPTSGRGSVTNVTINGSGFGNTQGTSTVTFNGTTAPIVSWGNRQIVATVPCAITAGATTIQVTVGGNQSNAVSFTVQPYISSLVPASGSVGTRVAINGCNFGTSQGTSTLTFNGVAVTVDPSRDPNDSWTQMQINAAVPQGATTGPVVVTVSGQASNSATFTVTISIACASADCKMFPDVPSVQYTVTIYPNGWTTDITLSTSIVEKFSGIPSDGLFTVSFSPNPVPKPTNVPQTSTLTITVIDPVSSAGIYTVTVTASGGITQTASFDQAVDPIITLAGNGQAGYAGDGGQATAAKLYYPTDTVSDASGNVYIADRNNHRVRKVATNRVITTIAGTGSTTCLGDGGAATSACLSSPYGLAIDSSSNLYIADYGHCRIRKVTTAGIISTVAGNGTCGFAGDGGAATAAQLRYPTGVFVDGSGNIFIADRTNHRIRKVNAATGVITTIAGTGTAGFGGDGGAATSALLNQPRTIYVNGSGEVFIADGSNNRIRKISTTGIISTFAGTGSTSCLGDGGAATSACLYYPFGISGDNSGYIYIADTYHHRIRKVNGGIITTVAGTGVAGYNGDNITPTKAKLQYPWSVHIHTLNGYKYMEIADTNNMRVRRVWPLP